MNAISGGCSLNTSATTMRIARISAWGKKRRTAELIPKALVASFRRSDSAGCIIVTIGLPDPGSCFHPSFHIHATCAHTGSSPMEWPLLRTLSVALGLLLEVVAKRRGVIFGTDDILARDTNPLAPARRETLQNRCAPPFDGNNSNIYSPDCSNKATTEKKVRTWKLLFNCTGTPRS
jgi:hypothetical protein